ncbi:hypothetical protein ACQ4PT_010086 [Festuca glaucescens]
MASSTGQEQVRNLEEQADSKDDAVVILTMLEGTFQVVMTTMTVGDHNKMMRFSHLVTWIELVVVLFCALVNIAAITHNSACSSWDTGFPWRHSVAVLFQVYVAVVYLEIRCLSLFLPQAPFAAWKALVEVGYKGTGSAALGATFVAIFTDQAWLHMHIACLLGLLIALAVALWVWLARTYGGAPVSVYK